MFYKFLARSVCLIHSSFLIAIIAGLPIAYFWHNLRPYHSSLAIATLASWPLCRGCPFTRWENSLLAKGSAVPYEGTCISHYSQKSGVTISDRFVRIGMVCILAASVVQYLGLV